MTGPYRSQSSAERTSEHDSLVSRASPPCVPQMPDQPKPQRMGMRDMEKISEEDAGMFIGAQALVEQRSQFHSSLFGSWHLDHLKDPVLLSLDFWRLRDTTQCPSLLSGPLAHLTPTVTKSPGIPSNRLWARSSLELYSEGKEQSNPRGKKKTKKKPFQCSYFKGEGKEAVRKQHQIDFAGRDKKEF